MSVKFAKFANLPETQRQKLIQQFHLNFEFWGELIVDEIKNVFMDIFGDEPKVAYSVGGSQEYAATSGTIQYQKGFMDKLRRDYGTDAELMKVATDWRNLQRKNFYALTAKLTLGRDCTICTAYDERHRHGWSTNEQDSDVSDVVADFNHWAMKKIQGELEFQTSMESIESFYEGQEFEIEED